MSGWDGYAAGSILAALVGAGAVLLLLTVDQLFLDGLKGFPAPYRGKLPLILVVVWIAFLATAVLYVTMSILGEILIVLKIRGVWFTLLIALILGVAVAAIPRKREPNTVRAVAKLTAPSIILVATFWTFWWIVFGHDNG